MYLKSQILGLFFDPGNPSQGLPILLLPLLPSQPPPYPLPLLLLLLRHLSDLLLETGKHF